MTKKTNEVEDNSIDAMIHQGKSVEEWQKLLKGFDFTKDQIVKMIKAGEDFGRLLQGLNESEADFDNPVFKDEEFFFNENDNKTLDESSTTKDVVTVEDFMDALRSDASLDDKVAFIAGNKAYALDDIRSKGGVTVIDFVEKNAEQLNESIDSEEDEDAPLSVSDLIDELKDSTRSPNLDLALANVEGNPYYITKVVAKKNAVLLRCRPAGMNESLSYDQWREAFDWFNANGYPIEDDEGRLNQIGPQLDQFLFKKGCSPTGEDKIVSGNKAYELYQQLKENDSKPTNEGRGWYGGGYGGTGKSWKDLDQNGPRGASIGWYSVEDLDPKAKGKMPGWRCGPSNFPFVDLLYPERKYKVGTMVMRNKYIKAGSMSGQKYIAIPSYFAAIKDNDQEAINLLTALGIPLDLTFGMDPNDDYSVTYTQKSMNEEEEEAIDGVTDYSVTLSDFINHLYQISDKWGDDLLVKVVTPEPQRKYLDPKVTVNSKGGTKVVAIN